MPQKLLQPSTAQRGFTLPELLIAAVIGLGVVGLGGMGLVSILGSSKSASAQTDRRAELNRSLEFIATEVRHADTIAQDAAAAAKPASFTSSLPITNAQPVLVLRLAAASEPIIYYIGAASDNTWLGPRVVYRWGPAYDVQGNFSNPTDPSNWTHEPLIDQIDDSSAQPTCPSSGMPKVNGLAGFFACVDSAGKVAEIHQMGQVSKPLGIKETYQVSSAVSTRPVAAVPPSFTTPVGTRLGRPFTVENGKVTFTEDDTTVRVNYIGGEITCGAGGSNIPKNVTLELKNPDQTMTLAVANSSNPYSIKVDEGTVLTITGNMLNSGCGSGVSYNSATHNWNTASAKQAITLFDGDLVPNFKPYGGQAPIISFLNTEAVLNNGQLANNQIVFLFELGDTYTQNYARSPAFDMQDVVVDIRVESAPRKAS